MRGLSLSPLKIFAGSGATLFVFLVSIYLSFQRFTELKNAEAWNIHTYKVLLETSNVMRGLVDIQTGARGFLQTRDETFLTPYRLGRDAYREHYNNVLGLTRDRPIQQKRLQLLERQYSVWMKKHIEPLIKMRRSVADLDTAMRLASSGVRTRKALMDDMRKTVAEIEVTERALLKERTDREKQVQALTQATLVTNGVFATVMATVFSLFLIAGTRNLQSANRQLTEEMGRREKAEQQASILSEHNKMILEAAQDGIAGVNQAGRTTFFNPAAEAITGYSEAEVLGKPHHALLHHKHADGSPYPLSECPISATLRDAKSLKSDDDVFWRKDGKAVPVEFTSTPLVMPLDQVDNTTWSRDGTPLTEDGHPDGKQVGAVIIFRDITERKKSEAALQELAAIVQYSDDCIISLTLNGIVTRWNQAAAKVYGYSQSEMVGQPLAKLLPPGREDELPELLVRIRHQQPVERYETTHLRKDNSQVQVVVSLSPIVDPSGQVTGASSISREVFRSRLQKASENNPV
jgi:PAS domain S-box-containing protein